MTEGEPVVVPRGDVHWVATEYGIANLFGKSMQERVMAMITIAHPNFRDELLHAAKDMGLIGKERNLGEAVRAVYPVGLEDNIVRGDKRITIRPAKPVDERRIQEHYYTLDKKDVFSRFFHDKKSFNRSDLENKSHIDYIKDLTLIGVVGEIGFDEVIGVGEYLLIVENNMAEVAFSVSKDYQGLGLGKIFLKKLAEAARSNGISGLMAYTVPSNKAMIKLFKTLPYKVKTVIEDDALVLSCKFNELREELA
jgi:RimJ/RimL family protein N-acetyltransferase